VVLTGGLLGIVAIRVVIGQLLTLVRRYPTIVDGAFIIIAWVGIKLLLEYLNSAGVIHFEIDKWLSLALIGIIFTIAYLRARRKGPMADDDPRSDEASVLLADNRSS
jgi:predicted tellurium resistance membrane protein TerC